MRRLQFLLFLPISFCSVVPVWKTPITERRFAPPQAVKRSSSPYYTRPEDFKVPSYVPPSNNGPPPPPPPRIPITPPGYRPNYNIYPQNYRVPQQSAPPPRPAYPQGQQPRPQSPSYPNGWVYWNGDIVPPEAIPYLQGAGPIPPQGAYGPPPSSKSPASPGVRPETFTGTIPMSPSVSPTEVYTTGATSPQYEQPTAAPTVPAIPTTSAEEGTSTLTPEEATMGSLFTAKKNPFPTPNVPEREKTTDGTTRGPVGHEASTPGYEETTTGQTASSQEEYFPRPVPSQSYQPAKGPEIVEKLNVNILHPNGPCTGPLCFDKSKVSVYTPPKGPKFLISNAAKGQASLPRPSVPEYKHLPYAPNIGTSSRPIEPPHGGPRVFMHPDEFSLPPYDQPTPPPSSQQPYSPTARTLPPSEEEYQGSPPSAPPPSPPSYTPHEEDVTPIVPDYNRGPASTFPPQQTEVPPSGSEEVPSTTPRLPEWATETPSEGTFSPTYRPLFPVTPPEVPTPPPSSEVTPRRPEEGPRIPPREEAPPGLPGQPPVPPTGPPRGPIPGFPSQPFTPPPGGPTPPIVFIPESPTPAPGTPVPPFGETPFTPGGPPPSSPGFPPPGTPPRVPPTGPPQLPGTPPTGPIPGGPPPEQTVPPFSRIPPGEGPGTPPAVPSFTPRTPPTEGPRTPGIPPQTVPPFEGPRTPGGPPPQGPFTPGFPPREGVPSTPGITPPRGTPPSAPRTPPGPPLTPQPTRRPPLEGPRITTPYFVSETSTPPSLYTSTPKKGVQNRLRAGKVRVICQEDGIKFIATSILPFTGEIFANDRKRVPACFHSYQKVLVPMAFLPFDECGVRNANDHQNNQTQYHMQVVVVVTQEDGSTTVQSYMAQCVQQKVQYNKQTLPRRIEEALEELRLVPTKLEQKALLPLVEMKLVVDEHGRIGPEVAAVDIGMPLALHWKLTNESAAYGFHVRNCAVADTISGVDMMVVDEQGCSTDTTILAHPHYDTYHDTASSHMWAFKVPDHTKLRLSCEVSICTDIAPVGSNETSCSSIPTPPFCPDLITSPSNSILFDGGGKLLKRRREIEGMTETQTVRAAICTSDSCRRDYVALPHCVDPRWLAASSAFSISLFFLSIFVNLGLRCKISFEKKQKQSGR